MPRVAALKNSTILFAYLFVVWGFYRLLGQLPEEIEELVLKPIIWLVPVFYFVRREKAKLASIGLTFKNFFPAIYFSLFLGLIFVGEAVLVNWLKYGGIRFTAEIGDKALMYSLVISSVTAISEEITFRGYIFTRLTMALKSELLGNLLTTAGWTLIHLPITLFIWKFDALTLVTYLFLTTLFGFGSAFIFARTKNITSSILLHLLWEWPIILFR